MYCSTWSSSDLIHSHYPCQVLKHVSNSLHHTGWVFYDLFYILPEWHNRTCIWNYLAELSHRQAHRRCTLLGPFCQQECRADCKKNSYRSDIISASDWLNDSQDYKRNDQSNCRSANRQNQHGAVVAPGFICCRDSICQRNWQVRV